MRPAMVAAVNSKCGMVTGLSGATLAFPITKIAGIPLHQVGFGGVALFIGVAEVM